jgi:hypothetical protein
MQMQGGARILLGDDKNKKIKKKMRVKINFEGQFGKNT